MGREVEGKGRGEKIESEGRGGQLRARNKVKGKVAIILCGEAGGSCLGMSKAYVQKNMCESVYV